MTDSSAFAHLLDDAAFLSFEHQLHLDDVLGEHSWHVDMEAGIFAFDTEHGVLECSDFHFLGSAAPDAGSWLWSWANQSGFPKALSVLAESVRDFGAAQHIRELSTAELPFDAFPIDWSEPNMVVAAQTDVAKVITSRWNSYTPVTGPGGTHLAFLVEHPDFRLPPPEGSRVMRVLSEGLMTLTMQDHRRAISSYMSLRGINSTFSPDNGQLMVDSPSVSGAISFDEAGRAISFDIELSSSPTVT